MEPRDSSVTRSSALGHGDVSSSVPEGILAPDGARPSRFEHILTTYPPILSSVLAQLPTKSVISLHFTSRTLRDYLACYPLAWANLSYRQPKSNVSDAAYPWVWSISSGSESSGDTRDFSFMLDKHLQSILSFSTLLTRLDLDNTAVDGLQLFANVVGARRETLRHLSIRGCKQVSLKYHVLPFLEIELSLQEPGTRPSNSPLALKSLYIHRCRHHRKRAYLPISLIGRDSDSQPTHTVIELCHMLGIWTDTAWCPSPGRRCLRRKDYGVSRSVPPNGEIWVPYDRLWRSQNAIGTRSCYPAGSAEQMQGEYYRGRLWEQQEIGCDGEATGSSTAWPLGEGKEVPMHLRRSHRMFVEGFKCASCHEPIPERCEQCSIRMHCMGCRKTLCASCAYDIPLSKKKAPSRYEAFSHENAFTVEPAMGKGRRKRTLPADWWWPAGSVRSPNSLYAGIIDRPEVDSDDSDAEMEPIDNRIPKLKTRWCCISTVFSGSGGPVTHSNVYAGNVRASPLPSGRGYEDPALRTTTEEHSKCRESGNVQAQCADAAGGSLEDLSGADLTLMLDSYKAVDDHINSTLISPRTLCSECYDSNAWKIPCSGCKGPLCYDHDVQLLKVRRCGWRNLMSQRSRIKAQNIAADAGQEVSPEHMMSTMSWFFSKWTPIVRNMLVSAEVRAWDHKRMLLQDMEMHAESTSSRKKKHPCMGSFLRSRIRSSLVDPQPAVSSPPKFMTPSQEFQFAETISETLSPSALVQFSQPTAKRKSQRPRSSSLSAPPPSNTTKPSSPNIHRPPAWTGCNRYYCPAPRSHTSDRRFHCRGNAISECNTCGTWVCKACALADRLAPTKQPLSSFSSASSSSSSKFRTATAFPAGSAFDRPLTGLSGVPQYKSHRQRPRPRPRPRDLLKPCACQSCASLFRCPNCRRSKAVLDACVYEQQERTQRAQLAARCSGAGNAASTSAAAASSGSGPAGAGLANDLDDNGDGDGDGDGDDVDADARAGQQEQGIDHVADWMRLVRREDRERAQAQEWGVGALSDFWAGVSAGVGDAEVFRAWLVDLQDYPAASGRGRDGEERGGESVGGAEGGNWAAEEDGLDGLRGFWWAVGVAE